MTSNSVSQIMMKAIIKSADGGPDVLTLAEVPRPTARFGEILIKVVAAGVNRPDCLQRQGVYPPPSDASPLLGLEVAGEVVEIGEGVPLESFKLGAKVTALTPGGGYAEYCRCPWQQALPIPEGLTWVEAAALPETHFTVYYNLFMRAGLAKEESLLVHGGSSGIGTTAIMLARALRQAKLYTTVGNPQKQQACEALGAKALLYPEANWADQILALRDGQGLDVVLDMVGAPYLADNIRLLAPDGRLSQVAVSKGSLAELNLRDVMVKRLTITGSTMRPLAVARKKEIADRLLAEVWPLYQSKQLKPIIHTILPLAKAAEAHHLMESSQHIGKIMLII